MKFGATESTPLVPKGPWTDVLTRQMHYDCGSKPRKPAAQGAAKKSPGTVAVEKYRPAMNKLMDAEREKLLARAMVTIYGQPENAGRR